VNPLRRAAASLLSVLSLSALPASAADPAPWVSGLTGLPPEAQSALILRQDEHVFLAPRPDAPRRGTLFAGSNLPIFASTSAPGCPLPWLMLGPMAWLCRSHVQLSAAPPLQPFDLPPDPPDGLPFRYFFVGANGSALYRRFEFADMAEPEQELQKGFAVTVVEQRSRGGDVYGRTHRERWVPMRDLIPVRPFLFQGEEVASGRLDMAWVLDDKTPVFARPDGLTRAKAPAFKMRFEVVRVLEETQRGSQTFLRIGDNLWMRARDLRRPSLSPPPEGLLPGERWIDVELASQTLVAYEGERPVFATLVSTGKGAQKTATATPKGVHRIWVKLRTSTMDNLDDENAFSNYAIEDVPYVQFFNKGVALHAAFWHRGFGRVRSHGCVNLAPLDAQRLFHFTGPRLPAGWSAAFPTEFEPGTIIQVRLSRAPGGRGIRRHGLHRLCVPRSGPSPGDLRGAGQARLR
jgi:hypothetical protein